MGDTEVRVRVEAEKLGQSVPRGFLKIVEFPGQPQVNPRQSGRLELAQWLTSEKNPLTSRVLANRVWQHLFGQGLVRSVDNFGVTGEAPSHPELLDHLARQFLRDGWSVKRLIRYVVLTRAYQLDSELLEANFAVDPDNRLIWRHVPRRLDAEEIRDATLAASGKLDLARPDGSPARDLKVIELPNNGPLARCLGEAARASLHRSLYLPLLRDLTPTSLEVFDFAQQATVTGSRETTTVATQALYALNDPFVIRQAVALAERVLLGSREDDIARVNLAYRMALNRGATRAEISRVQTYLHDYGKVGPGGGVLTGSKFKFSRRGETGTWISELLPNVARHVDKLCFIRGLYTGTPAHPQAVIQLHPGASLVQLARPSMGAWLLYGLGTENQDLPGYITINPPPAFGGVVNYGTAFLPAHFQGTRIVAGRSSPERHPEILRTSTVCSPTLPSPHRVVIATSAASLPTAIGIRTGRTASVVASMLCHAPLRKTWATL